MDIILLFLAKPLDKHGTTLVHITYPPLEDMKEVKLGADWINTVTNTIKEQISVSHSENINLKKITSGNVYKRNGIGHHREKIK